MLGFKSFRDANAASVPTVSPARTPRQQALYEKGIRTRDLDLLKADVIAGTLPQVSWICATSSGSEHPSASSPAQGAAYIAQVLDALTANPDVWSKTVLIVNFDENDGFFDHVAPPAPPSYVTWSADPTQAVLAGASTVDASDEYLGDADGGITSVDPYKHHPFGLGPRVPLYVISPWSKGGWVNSQVFDQTSTIRFIENALRRDGAQHQRVAPRGRRRPDVVLQLRHAQRRRPGLVAARHHRARRRQPRARQDDHAARRAGAGAAGAGAGHQAVARAALRAARHRHGGRRARPAWPRPRCGCTFANVGTQAAVFHVYDRNNLTAIPRRYTVEAGKTLADTWAPLATGAYDLWVLAPNGFHRHFTGNARRVASAGQPNPDVVLSYDVAGRQLRVQLTNGGPVAATFALSGQRVLPGDARDAVGGRAQHDRRHAAARGQQRLVRLQRARERARPTTAAASRAGWKPAPTRRAIRRCTARRSATSTR